MKLLTEHEDTIVAISTALSNSAISIIKISGSDAIKITNKIFSKDLSKVKSHTISYGLIKENDKIIDEVLVSVFISPSSFTKENVVEINCHGGIFVTNKILEILLSNGCRLAEPGEFTKRAFLNGRIDLTKAEAVMDIIKANTNHSLSLASNALLGETTKLIDDFKKEVMELLIAIEVNIDYPEYEDEDQIKEELLKPRIDKLLEKINDIINKSEVSKIIKEGIDTAIIGRPNVGKSSLLNQLLREDKAIVTNIAGTTRDIVEGQINIGGVVLNLIDTAGVRATNDIVEKQGVLKSKKVLEEAKLIILVFDNNETLSDIDIELLEKTKDKQRIIVINKKDLERKIDVSLMNDYIEMSSFDKEDIHKLESKIKQVTKISDLQNIDATYIGNARQISKLIKAKTSLSDAIKAIDRGMPVDIIGIDIKGAWMSLGEILGEVHSDDIINEMFSRFCLGK